MMVIVTTGRGGHIVDGREMALRLDGVLHGFELRLFLSVQLYQESQSTSRQFGKTFQLLSYSVISGTFYCLLLLSTFRPMEMSLDDLRKPEEGSRRYLRMPIVRDFPVIKTCMVGTASSRHSVFLAVHQSRLPVQSDDSPNSMSWRSAMVNVV